jgi:hypothetical protein
MDELCLPYLGPDMFFSSENASLSVHWSEDSVSENMSGGKSGDNNVEVQVLAMLSRSDFTPSLASRAVTMGVGTSELDSDLVLGPLLEAKCVGLLEDIEDRE